MSMEEAGDGIHQDRKGRLAKLTARLAQRQAPFHPAVAFVARRPVRTLAPQHGKAQRSLSIVVGRLNALFTQKHPQRGHFSHQPPGQPPSVVRTLLVLLNQLTKPGIPRPPLSASRRRFGHLTQSLQLPQRPRPACCQVRIMACRQAPRRADEMCQAGLPLLDPILIHAIAITHQDTRPVIIKAAKAALERLGWIRYRATVSVTIVHNHCKVCWQYHGVSSM